MDQAAVTAYCLGKPGAELLRLPRLTDTGCAVGGVFFAYPDEHAVTLRAGRDAAESSDIQLRHLRDVQIVPYTGRDGWVAVVLDGDVTDDELRDLLDLSYTLARTERS